MESRKQMLYRDKLATVKSRGVVGLPLEYIYTEHKRAVREKGFELPSDVPLVPRVEFDIRKIGENPFDGGRDGRDKNDGDKKPRNDFDEEIGRFESSVVRARSKVMELGFNNPWDWFVTFTLSPKLMWDNFGVFRYDLDGSNRALRCALNNYRKRHAPEFRYLVIPEFHSDGAVHYHGFLSGVPEGDIILNEHNKPDFTHFSQRFGFVNIDEIRDRKKVVSYVTKYTTKGMFAGFKGEGKVDFKKHLYFCSKHLKRDILVAKGEPAYRKEDFEDAGHDFTVDNEFCYKITFADKDEDWAKKLVRGFGARSLGFELSFAKAETPRTDAGLAVYKSDKRAIENRRKLALSKANAYENRIAANDETLKYNEAVKAFNENRATHKDLQRLGVITNIFDDDGGDDYEFPDDWGASSAADGGGNDTP